MEISKSQGAGPASRVIKQAVAMNLRLLCGMTLVTISLFTIGCKDPSHSHSNRMTRLDTKAKSIIQRSGVPAIDELSRVHVHGEQDVEHDLMLYEEVGRHRGYVRLFAVFEISSEHSWCVQLLESTGSTQCVLLNPPNVLAVAYEDIAGSFTTGVVVLKLVGRDISQLYSYRHKGPPYQKLAICKAGQSKVGVYLRDPDTEVAATLGACKPERVLFYLDQSGIVN